MISTIDVLPYRLAGNHYQRVFSFPFFCFFFSSLLFSFIAPLLVITYMLFVGILFEF